MSHLKENLYTSILALSLIALIGCKKQDPVVNNNPNTPSGYYISYDLDGTSHVEENGVAGFQLSFSNSKNVSAQNNTINASPGSGFYNFSDQTAPNSTITFENNLFVLSDYSSQQGNIDALNAIFTEGSQSYDGTADFVKLSYNSSTSWKTSLGTQTGSTFEVTTSTSSTNTLGEAEQDVKGTFKCTVYDGNGNSKSVDNGKFHLLFSAP